MPPTQPWRDIPSASAVQAELHRLDGGKRRPPGNTQQRTALKAAILSQIDAYHRVTKDALFMLKTRAGMLHSIEKEKVPATKSGELGQSRCANHPDLVAGTFFSWDSVN